MAKPLNRGIDKDAMFKKIMPSAASAPPANGFDSLDSFAMDDEELGSVRPKPRKKAAQTARASELNFDELDLLESISPAFDPLDSFALLDDDIPPPKRKKTARSAAQEPQNPAVTLRPKRTVSSVKQAGAFPIDTTVLQNPIAPDAPIPAPQHTTPQPLIEPQSVIAAPAAPTAPIPAPQTNLQPPPSYYDTQAGVIPAEYSAPPPAYAPAPYPPQQPAAYYPPQPYPAPPPYTPTMQATTTYAPMKDAPDPDPEPALDTAQLEPVNLTRFLLDRQIPSVMTRLRACACDCCRTQIALRALDQLPVHYALAGEITEEQLYDRKTVSQVVTALCQAALFVKAHPQH